MDKLVCLIAVGLLFLSTGCSKPIPACCGGHDICETRGPVVVYKTRYDYSNNVSVQLSDDKKTITAYPGPTDAIKPTLLANGYYLQTMLGNAFLSITIDEYRDSSNKYPFDKLMNYMLDSAPYTEHYELCECSGRDTFSLNNLIRHDSIGMCHQ
jgi:hypothetical protein